MKHLISSVLISALLLVALGCGGAQNRRGAQARADMESALANADAATIIADRDGNGDGLLTLDEFSDGARGNPERAFPRIDSNGDDLLDEAELDAMIERVRTRTAANRG